MSEEKISRNRQDYFKEYESLISLYVHEDNFMLKVFQLAILLNSLLAGLAKFGPETPTMNIILAILGMVSCYGWHLMATSSVKHRDLVTYQASSIEKSLDFEGIFLKQFQIFPRLTAASKNSSETDSKTSSTSDNGFKLHPYYGIRASSVISNWLPALVGIFWFVSLISELIP